MLFNSNIVIFAHIVCNFLRWIQCANQASSRGDNFRQFKINYETNVGLYMSETALSSLSCEIINDYPKMKIHHDKIM